MSGRPNASRAAGSSGDYQVIEHMLVDMTMDIMAAKSLLYLRLLGDLRRYGPQAQARQSIRH